MQSEVKPTLKLVESVQMKLSNFELQLIIDVFNNQPQGTNIKDLRLTDKILGICKEKIEVRPEQPKTPAEQVNFQSVLTEYWDRETDVEFNDIYLGIIKDRLSRFGHYSVQEFGRERSLKLADKIGL